MTRAELLAFFDKTVAESRALMSRKNQDYAEIDEVFGNLDLCEVLGVCRVESGIIIRMSDKLRRLASLTRRDAACKDESIEDTCRDLINYSVLLLAKRSTRPFNPDNDKDLACPTNTPSSTEASLPSSTSPTPT